MSESRRIVMVSPQRGAEKVLVGVWGVRGWGRVVWEPLGWI